MGDDKVSYLPQGVMCSSFVLSRKQISDHTVIVRFIRSEAYSQEAKGSSQRFDIFLARRPRHERLVTDKPALTATVLGVILIASVMEKDFSASPGNKIAWTLPTPTPA